MAERLNPGDKTVAESDYAKKFDRIAKEQSVKNTKKLQEQEAAGDTTWKTDTKKPADKGGSKSKFRFAGRRAGKIHHISVFTFIFITLGLGLWYTSFFRR